MGLFFDGIQQPERMWCICDVHCYTFTLPICCLPAEWPRTHARVCFGMRSHEPCASSSVERVREPLTELECNPFRMVAVEWSSIIIVRGFPSSLTTAWKRCRFFS